MNNKERFMMILQDTHRDGVENVIRGLEGLGFFDAPASTRFHGSVPGGLLQHSLNVYDEAMVIRESQIKFRPELARQLPVESVAIASLLHDVCKAEIYKLEDKFRKDAYGRWEKYKGYNVDYSQFPVGHGEKSVIRLLRWGLNMTDDEIVAIRWHMQAFDMSSSPQAIGNFNAAGDKFPLLAIVVTADWLATRILETN